MTSDRVFQAILKAQPKIESAFGATNQTISDGMTKVNNALTQYIGQTDDSLSASDRLVQGLNALADNFDNVADRTLQLAAIIAGALVGRSIAGMIAKLSLGVVALTRFTAALAAARTAGGLAVAMGGLSAAAGPVGLVIGTVLTGALIAFGTRSGEASDAAKKYANALKEVEEAAKNAAPAVKGVATAAAEMKAAKEALELAEDGIKKVQRELQGGIALLDGWTMRSYVSSEQLKQLKALETGLADGSIKAEEAREKLMALAGESPDNKWLTEFINPLIDGLEKAQRAAKRLRDEVRIDAAKSIPADPGIAGRKMQMGREAGQRFLDQRSKDAAKTEVEKEIDTRTKAIVKAANDVGVAITEAAARIQAQTEIGIEQSTAAVSKAAASAVELVKGFEGYSAKAYYDVNAYRNGYGSDTMTSADGNISRVTAQSITTLADANRDLARRIGEFQDGIRGKIGGDKFASMSENQQAALTSIAYNYGSLPDRIVKAIQGGNEQTVYEAIKGLGGDNGGINSKRRKIEAETYLNGSSAITQSLVSDSDKASEDAATRAKNFAEALEQQKRHIESLKAETAIRQTLNPLVNDYGQAMSEVEAAQYLLTAAQEEQTEAGKELVDVQQLLYGDLSTLTPAAREQAEAMRTLAQQTGEAEAAASRLGDAQKDVAEAMRQSSEFGKNVLGGFIRDMQAGKSAAEALEGALGKVADRLLDMALNSLFDGAGAGSGGGILGAAFSWLFPHKNGGIAANGKPSSQPLKRYAGGGISRTAAIFGEAGPEAAVPLPDGRRIPVDLRTPDGASRGSNSQSLKVVVGVDVDSSGNLKPFVTKVSGDVADVKVAQGQNQAQRQFPAIQQDRHRRYN